jgi:twinkle protein
VDDAESQDPQELQPASSYCDEVVKEFYPPPGYDIGFRLPWPKAGRRFIFRPGQVTVLAGVNGHGKSEGAGHIVLGALKQEVKACVASLEFRPQKWLYRMTRQAAGVMAPAIPYIKAIHSWYAGKLWVLDITGTAKASQILEVFRYARLRYGVKLFVIDNLSKLDIGLEDYDKQRGFVDSLTDFAKEINGHVILVAHMRKGQDDHQPASKMSIKGSGAITDLADNVLVWWRNRPKEEKIRKAGGNSIDESIFKKPDAIVGRSRSAADSLGH